MTTPMQAFSCNTCGLRFVDSKAQREHMRSDWHVGNLRRRIAGEEGRGKEEYEEACSQVVGKLRKRFASPATIEEAEEGYKQEEEEEREEEEEGIAAVEQCLFCSSALNSVHATLSHMTSEHALFIPHVDRISDLSSFLGFLNTLVFTHHECLYCGAQKGSLTSIRTHMKDKGHGKVRWEDVWEFWEEDEGGEEEVLKSGANAIVTKTSETEWKLPSGATMGSRSDSAHKLRHAYRNKNNHPRLRARAAIASSSSTPTSDRHLTIRPRNAELSLSGIADSQILTLQRMEKSQRSAETSAKTAYRHKMEQAPVLTKYYKKQNPVYQAG